MNGFNLLQGGHSRSVNCLRISDAPLAYSLSKVIVSPNKTKPPVHSSFIIHIAMQLPITYNQSIGNAE